MIKNIYVMKKIYYVLVLSLFSCTTGAQSVTLHGTELRDLNGRMVPVSAIIEEGHPLVMVFWKSGSSKCCENLETMQSAWMTRLRDRGVRFVAVCEDCAGSWSHVKPLVAGKGWDFDVYIDVNGDFRRSLGIRVIPSTVLFDAGMRMICKHPGWCSGNEGLICDKISGCLDNR
jgi:hypothetical protein